ncbi:MAG TPA: hypothetical protein VI911_09770 [Patescibacteria group bacterium]|nr:hypothetical protein [Patescibacteria group bacterium]
MKKPLIIVDMPPQDFQEIDSLPVGGPFFGCFNQKGNWVDPFDLWNRAEEAMGLRVWPNHCISDKE